MSALRIYDGSTTIVFEEEQPILSPYGDESVARLLVNLDVANRSEAGHVNETLRTLLEYAVRDGEDERNVVKQVVLVAFRRRNHQKSQADGEGSGEKLLFLEILLSIIALEKFNDLIFSVLPLVPVYGSWRDMLLLGEELSLRFTDPASETLHPINEAICRLFAQQLAEDEEGLLAEKKRESIGEAGMPEAADSKRRAFTPSNACKYVPHESRHDSGKQESRKRKREASAVSVGSDGPVVRRNKGRDGVRGGRGGGRGTGRGRGRDVSRVVATVSGSQELTSAEEALRRHRANKVLSLRIAQLLHSSRVSARPMATESSLLADYRRLRTSLNAVLAERGHLVEPLLVKKEAKAIRFGAASKGALVKYEKAINRDEVAKKRWKTAMLRNPSAVPDIDSLVQAVAQCLEEARDNAVEGEPLLLSLRAKKAVAYLRDRLTQVRQEALALQKEAASAVVAEAADVSPEKAVRQIVVVDSVGATDETARLSLLLAALLASVAQGSRFLVLDGARVSVPVMETEDLAQWLLHTASHFLSAAAVDDRDGNLLRLQTALRLALAEHATQHATQEDTDATLVDVLCLCVHFAVYDERSEEVHSLLEQLQQEQQTDDTASASPATTSATSSGVRLRTFRVHRLRGGAVGAQTHAFAAEFRPRDASLRRRPLPTDTSQMTADVLLLVDFTGSMGEWMGMVKRELVSLLAEIQTSSRMRNVRVALVGYRDYQDTGRVVTVDFKNQRDAQQLVDEIQSQRAMGGGDTPEDMLSGLVAARALDWQSDLRFCVVVTDAPAHGFCGDDRSGRFGSDSHPSGRCPDQTGADYPSFEQAMRHLAVDLEVDCFFCLLSNDDRDEPLRNTIRAMQKPYEETLGGGFGTVTMTAASAGGAIRLPGSGSGSGSRSRSGSGSGSGYFREQLVAQLSAAVAGSVVAKDLAGLQSADGLTLSSLALSLLASLRQSQQTDAKELLAQPLSVEDVVIDAVAVDNDDDKEEEAGEVAAAAAMDVDDDGAPAEDTAAVVAEDTGAGDRDRDDAAEDAAEERGGRDDRDRDGDRDRRSGRGGRRTDKGESDWQRLQRDLRASMLHPVRLALGLSLTLPTASSSSSASSASSSSSAFSLTALAAEALSRAGLTVAQLQERNFPEQIVRVFRDQLAQRLASL